MVYVVPEWKKSIKQNVFEFQLDEGGKTYNAPRFDLLPTTFAESLGELEEKHVVKALRLTLAGDDEALAELLGALPLSEIQKLIQAWQEHAKVSLGESSASGS